MFEYRFHRVPLGRKHEPYPDAVARAAREGWRLVQILIEVPAAVPSEYVLVLERPVPASGAAPA